LLYTYALGHNETQSLCYHQVRKSCGPGAFVRVRAYTHDGPESISPTLSGALRHKALQELASSADVIVTTYKVGVAKYVNQYV
jgi:hypothetical protein